jgi:ribokinase
VVGSLNVDHVINVEHLPVAGETVMGRGYFSVPGGKGLNQAVTAARLGALTSMVGCVGDGPDGQHLVEVLRREGVVTTGVRVRPGQPSGTALITVVPEGANTIVVAPGANALLSSRDVAAAAPLMSPGCVVLAQLEVPQAAVTAALEAARSTAAITVLNPAPAPGPLASPLLALADILIVNETEAEALTGQRAPEEAVRSLLDNGCGTVVVTLGAQGALVAPAGQPSFLVPAHKVAALDSTAAGDAFCAAVAVVLASGGDLVLATRTGCAAGALAATVRGALPSLPYLSAVKALMAEIPAARLP